MRNCNGLKRAKSLNTRVAEKGVTMWEEAHVFFKVRSDESPSLAVVYSLQIFAVLDRFS